MRLKYILSIIVFLFIFSQLSYTQQTGDQSTINFYQGDVTVTIALTEGDTLRVRAQVGDVKLNTENFFIRKKPLKIPVKTQKNGWRIGSYIITKDVNAFTVFKNDKKLYSSQFVVAGKYLKEIKKCFDKEHFYGIGQGADRFALYRYRVSLYQEARYGDRAHLNIPFFFTNNGDAFYYDASGRDTLSFRNKHSGEVHYSSKQQVIQYYYYHEPDLKKLVSRFYHFSDSKSLLPKWAYGYIQSKYGYKNQQEVYNIINKFEQYNIPISAIILDLYWFKHMGDLDYNPEAWPDPQKMDKFLEKRGIKLITISEPFYSVDSQNYKEFDKHGLLAKDSQGKTLNWNDWWCFKSKEGSIFNPLAPKAKEMLGKNYIRMVKQGIDAFWTDLGEPEKTPAAAMFNQFTELQFHNYYNRQWSRLIYETISETFPNKRVFILSRSGWTGSAKYGVSVWSGDVRSDFITLDTQATLGVNSGLTGFSYWGSDVGGFVSGDKIPEKELFIRWMQFGAFSPVFRPHGAMSAREPWIHGAEAMDIIKKFIQLRYRLLPYIYSTAYQTYKHGIPMMRPLLLEHPQDPHPSVSEIITQYYFGDALMAVPVTTPLKEAAEMDVYLPAGQWYDFYSYEKYKNGDVSIKLTLDKMPVFIKGGAIIPMREDKKDIILALPSKEKTSFVWYDDDGVSNDYKKGKFQAIRISLTADRIAFENVKKKRPVTLRIPKSTVTLKKLKNKALEKELFYEIPLKLIPGKKIYQF